MSCSLILVLIVSPLWPNLSACLFFFNDTATTEIYTLSLHDALPIFLSPAFWVFAMADDPQRLAARVTYPCVLKPLRSEEHTSELQSPDHLVCRLLLEKKKPSAT